jgi:hypothetical protein
MRQAVLLLLATALGILIAYVDSRPNWDDTGVTAGVVFLCCACLAAIYPKRPWLWALAVGMWIPIGAIIFKQNYGAWLALAVAFAGAYAGFGIRNLYDKHPSSNS